MTGKPNGITILVNNKPVELSEAEVTDSPSSSQPVCRRTSRSITGAVPTSTRSLTTRP